VKLQVAIKKLFIERTAVFVTKVAAMAEVLAGHAVVRECQKA
jgi:hypothetical protein